MKISLQGDFYTLARSKEMDVGRRKMKKENMNNACGMHDICPLLADTVGQRRDDLETINAKVVFVEEIVFWAGNKSVLQRCT